MFSKSQADSQPLRQYLWPLIVLIVLEALGLALVIQLSDAPITSFSALIATIVLSTGLLPAMLRPNPVADAGANNHTTTDVARPATRRCAYRTGCA